MTMEDHSTNTRAVQMLRRHLKAPSSLAPGCARHRSVIANGVDPIPAWLSIPADQPPGALGTGPPASPASGLRAEPQR